MGFIRLLAIALAGAVIGTVLGLPAAPLLGAMSTTFIASLLGVPMVFPQWLRSALIIAVGVIIGSAVNGRTIAGIWQWLPSITGLIVTQTVAIAGAMTCFRLLGGVRTHAAGFFAAVPGNLAIALQEAEKMDINIRLITTSQALRLILMAAIIPTVLHGFAPNAAADTAMESDWPALLAVTAAGVAGALGAYVLRVPTALLLGVLVKQKRTLTYATAASSCSLGVRPSLVECDRSLLYSISMNSTISRLA